MAFDEMTAVATREAARLERRIADLEAAIRIERKETQTVLALARPYVEDASTRYYDGVGGQDRREEAKRRLARLDVLYGALNPPGTPDGVEAALPDADPFGRSSEHG